MITSTFDPSEWVLENFRWQKVASRGKGKGPLLLKRELREMLQVFALRSMRSPPSPDFKASLATV